MPTIVGILTFMSEKNSILGLFEPKKDDFFVYFYTYEHLSFITSGADSDGGFWRRLLRINTVCGSRNCYAKYNEKNIHQISTPKT